MWRIDHWVTVLARNGKRNGPAQPAHAEEDATKLEYLNEKYSYEGRNTIIYQVDCNNNKYEILNTLYKNPLPLLQLQPYQALTWLTFQKIPDV